MTTRVTFERVFLTAGGRNAVATAVRTYDRRPRTHTAGLQMNRLVAPIASVINSVITDSAISQERFLVTGC